MSSKITSIGIANPPYKRNQNEVAELISSSFSLKPRQKKLLKAIYKSSGIDTRYSVISDYCRSPGEFEFFPNTPQEPFPSTSKRMQLYKDNALALAVEAIQHCLSGIDPFDKKRITHLITVSCTGMYAPGIDIEIIQQLGLQPSTKRTCINFMGCYGAFNGLKVANAFCQEDSNATVLVVCVELCSIHFQKAFNTEQIISNAIFADGAAAVLVQKQTDNPMYLDIDAFHCDLVPQTQQDMAWSIADFGFDIVLSSYVPDAIKVGIPLFIDKLFTQSPHSFDDIEFYAIHPGGIKILQACEEALNISAEDNKHSYEILRKFGNMSSATVLFVLHTIWSQLKKEDHGKNIFSCAFGPGLTLESALLRVHYQ
jgi:predicted naringenin-chalcone synthase